MDLQLPVQSMPIITKVERSNPVHGEVYFIFFNSKDSKSIYCKNNHENIINRDITTKYYLYLLYFTLDDFYLKFGLLLLHIIYEKKV
jgi:hypothetical protein